MPNEKTVKEAAEHVIISRDLYQTVSKITDKSFCVKTVRGTIYDRRKAIGGTIYPETIDIDLPAMSVSAQSKIREIILADLNESLSSDEKRFREAMSEYFQGD